MRVGTEGNKRIGEHAKVHVSLGGKYSFQLKTKGLKGNRKGETHWNNKIVYINPNILKIPINMNGLNSPIKRQRLTNGFLSVNL